MLDRNMWLIRSMLGGGCLRKRIDPDVTSLDITRTISLDEGYGHRLGQQRNGMRLQYRWLVVSPRGHQSRSG